MPYTPVTGVTLPLWIAVDEGFFAQQGIDVDAQFVGGGGSVITQAMTSGQYDVALVGGGDVALNHLAGGDLLLIAAYMSTFTVEAWAKPEIKAIADLKGKNAVVTRLGTTSHFAAISMLASGGLKADDVTFIQSGGNVESVATMVSGNADVGLVGYPDLLQAKQAGFHKLDYVHSGNFGLYPSVGAAVRRDWLQAPENRALALRCLRALDQGLRLARTDAALGKRSLRKYTKTDDEDVLQETWAYYQQYFPESLRVEETGVKNMLQLLDDPRARDADPRQFFDNSLVDQIGAPDR